MQGTLGIYFLLLCANNGYMPAQIPSYEPNLFSASQENLSILWNSNVPCRIPNARHLSLAETRLIQSTSLTLNFLGSTLILSYQIRLGLASSLFQVSHKCSCCKCYCVKCKFLGYKLVWPCITPLYSASNQLSLHTTSVNFSLITNSCSLQNLHSVPHRAHVLCAFLNS
jgi:hypothetical protein